MTAVAPALISAQICTLTASAASYVIPAASHYDATQTSNFTGVGTGDYLFEDGWWFRVAGDTQESFFPVPDTTACAGAIGTITWANVNSRGLFSATNRLSLTSAAANTGQLTLSMGITNLTASPLAITLFHGADFDVNGTAATDNATLLNANDHVRITDSTAGFAEYRAFNPPANALLVRPFATTTDVFGLLGDTSITNFDNSGIPASNIDYTGGFQWNFNIPANGTVYATVGLSGNTSLLTTAAAASVGGRVLVDGKRGLTNALVTLTDSTGNRRTVRTSSFGYYRFDTVPAGETYIVEVSSKSYRFNPQVVTVTEQLENLDFNALP